MCIAFLVATTDIRVGSLPRVAGEASRLLRLGALEPTESFRRLRVCFRYPVGRWIRQFYSV